MRPVIAIAGKGREEEREEGRERGRGEVEGGWLTQAGRSAGEISGRGRGILEKRARGVGGGILDV